MNQLPIKPNIKITIFGEEHDPSKEFELYASDQNLQCPKLSYSKKVAAPYGLSALIIYKKWEYENPSDAKYNYKENNYTIIHNLCEIHYLHRADHTDKRSGMPCAFESWSSGQNMFYFGEVAKEMHIIASPKWFEENKDDEDKRYIEYYYYKHPPITEFVHPSWTGYLPPYAAQPTNA